MGDNDDSGIDMSMHLLEDVADTYEFLNLESNKISKKSMDVDLPLD